MLLFIWQSQSPQMDFKKFLRQGLRVLLVWWLVILVVSVWRGGSYYALSFTIGWLAAVLYFFLTALRVWHSGSCGTASAGKRFMRAGSSIVLLLLIVFLMWATQSSYIFLPLLLLGMLSWQIILMFELVILSLYGVWQRKTK